METRERVGHGSQVHVKEGDQVSISHGKKEEIQQGNVLNLKVGDEVRITRGKFEFWVSKIEESSLFVAYMELTPKILDLRERRANKKASIGPEPISTGVSMSPESFEKMMDNIAVVRQVEKTRGNVSDMNV